MPSAHWTPMTLNQSGTPTFWSQSVEVGPLLSDRTATVNTAPGCTRRSESTTCTTLTSPLLPIPAALAAGPICRANTVANATANAIRRITYPQRMPSGGHPMLLRPPLHRQLGAIVRRHEHERIRNGFLRPRARGTSDGCGNREVLARR